MQGDTQIEGLKIVNEAGFEMCWWNWGYEKVKSLGYMLQKKSNISIFGMKIIVAVANI